MKSTGWSWLLLIFALGYLLVVFGNDFGRRTISYSEFKQHLAAGEIQQCEVAADRIRGELVPNVGAAEEQGHTFQAVRVEDPDLVAELQAAGIDYSGIPAG